MLIGINTPFPWGKCVSGEPIFLEEFPPLDKWQKHWEPWGRGPWWMELVIVRTGCKSRWILWSPPCRQESKICAISFASYFSLQSNALCINACVFWHSILSRSTSQVPGTLLSQAGDLPPGEGVSCRTYPTAVLPHFSKILGWHWWFVVQIILFRRICPEIYPCMFYQNHSSPSAFFCTDPRYGFWRIHEKKIATPFPGQGRLQAVSSKASGARRPACHSTPSPCRWLVIQQTHPLPRKKEITITFIGQAFVWLRSSVRSLKDGVHWVKRSPFHDSCDSQKYGQKGQ